MTKCSVKFIDMHSDKIAEESKQFAWQKHELTIEGHCMGKQSSDSTKVKTCIT